MKNTTRRGAVLLALLTAFAFVPEAPAQTLPEAGRNLLKRHERSLWRVDAQLRQTITMGDKTGNQDGRATAVGTLIDVGNLIAIPLSLLDPSRLMLASNPRASGMQVVSEVMDVKVQLPEGGELPATVVYRDKDLDLAFVATKEPLPKDAVPVRLTDAAKPDVLDTVILLGRSNLLGASTLIANAGYIQALVNKPQPAYFFELASAQSQGCPVFMPNGKVVGMILMGFSTGGRSDGSATLTATPLILPAETIREAAVQAEAARAKAATPPAK